jgi:hypothetical protein
MNKLFSIIIIVFILLCSLNNIQAKTIQVNLLLNGNFDEGPGIGWTEYSSKGWNIICSAAELPSLMPHSGTYVAWLGGDYNLNDYLYQDVVIPNNATDLTIKLYRYFATQETSGTYDQVALLIRNPNTNQILETLATWSNLDSTSSWVFQSIPISGNYAGMPVRVYFNSSSDSLRNTNFFLDTISLDAKITNDATIGALYLLLE